MRNFNEFEMKKFVLADAQCPESTPSLQELPSTVEDYISFWQQQGGVPTQCTCCGSSLRLAKANNSDGKILRCRNGTCGERHCVRPEFLKGLEGTFVELHLHYYLCCLRTPSRVRQTMFGVSPERTTEFLKRFRNILLLKILRNQTVAIFFLQYCKQVVASKFATCLVLTYNATFIVLVPLCLSKRNLYNFWPKKGNHSSSFLFLLQTNGNMQPFVFCHFVSFCLN